MTDPDTGPSLAARVKTMTDAQLWTAEVNISTTIFGMGQQPELVQMQKALAAERARRETKDPTR